MASTTALCNVVGPGGIKSSCQAPKACTASVNAVGSIAPWRYHSASSAPSSNFLHNDLLKSQRRLSLQQNAATRSGPQRATPRARVAEQVGVKQALKYNKLGESDLMISEITLGTMTWGNQNTEKEAHEQLSYAFDQGINIFDSAEMYPVPPGPDTQGSTDRYISTWLKSQPRDKVIVATKVAGRSDRINWLRDGGEVPAVDRKNVKESVEKSLRRLGTDHIDLLQIHWPDRYVALFGEDQFDPSKRRAAVSFEEQLRALDEVIKEGKVRYVGVSNETSYGVLKFIHAAEQHGLPRIVSIQNNYSLLVRSKFEADLVETCTAPDVNVGLLAYSPLTGGALSGKYLEPSSDAAKKGRFKVFPGYQNRYINQLATEAIRAYADVAAKHGYTSTQLALAWARDQSHVTSAIIGATSMAQLKENLSAWTLPRPLPQEVHDDIAEVYKRYRDPTLF
ncbi:aldo keto reductase [Klebsormidium nitens]|uniref:Aldo keto reductase n=1 Tax=Klebsormidium nitens TaxID=105231 RepID=A0A1Y1HPK3_KLENI|nr:aldo keto reductase [Klebsormidium nitens]|eukprot:GAQ79993.1 aldo keto reductase [Klebsormidium nitens]